MALASGAAGISRVVSICNGPASHRETFSAKSSYDASIQAVWLLARDVLMSPVVGRVQDDRGELAAGREELAEDTRGVAHDLNNILGALVASWQLLDRLDGDTTLASPEVQDTVRDMAYAIGRSRSLVPRILDLADAIHRVPEEREGREHGPSVDDTDDHPPSDPKPCRLLLVDDDLCFGRATKRLLEKLGYEVQWVTTGQQAVDGYRPAEHDAVLLDLDLPDLAGEQVLEAVGERFPGARVVIHTGHAGAARLEALRRDRPRLEIVSKPADVRELERAVAAAGPAGRPKRSLICGDEDETTRVADGTNDGGRGPVA